VNRRCIVLALVLAGASLAACGGDESSQASPPVVTEDPSAGAPTATAAETAVPTSVAQGESEPLATVAPDLPAEYVGEVGPVAVSGTSLQPLGQGTAIEADPALGVLAPTLIGMDYDGHVVRVEPGTEGPIMLVFLAHWCPHCNSEVPRINELRDAGRFPSDLKIVAVSTAVAPGQPNFPPSEWVGDVEWTYPVIADGIDMQRQTFIAADAYGVDGFPFITLVGADGKVAARWSGESQSEEIISRIEQYLAA
jgi:thiol-disulfide isomerase/thioredoxin